VGGLAGRARIEVAKACFARDLVAVRLTGRVQVMRVVGAVEHRRARCR
jgi:hypothetical protein